MPREVREPTSVERARAAAEEGIEGLGRSMAGTLAVLQAVDRMRTAGLILNATLGAAVIGALKGRSEAERALNLAAREAESAERHFRETVELNARLQGGSGEAE
jgi:hypothetical protein